MAEDIFKCIFLNENVLVSMNGLAPTRCQAIIWTEDDQFTDAYMHHSASVS